MQHAEIMKYWLLTDEEQQVIAVNTEEVEPPKLVFTNKTVAPEWFNVLRASGAMYQQLTRQFEALQSLIELAETVGANESLVRTFIELQNAILLTQRVAVEGVEIVGKAIDNEMKSS